MIICNCKNTKGSVSTMNIKTFSERLKESRKANNLTQAELCKLSGVTSATISAYESTDDKKGCNPSLDNAIKLANALNVSLDWLCGTTSNKSKIEITDFLKTLVKLRESVNLAIDTVDLANDENKRVLPNATRLLQNDEFTRDILINLEQTAEHNGEQFTYTENFIYFDNFHISKFLSEWQKMYDLYSSKTIDENLYNLWLDKQYKDIDQQIKANEDECIKSGDVSNGNNKETQG